MGYTWERRTEVEVNYGWAFSDYFVLLGLAFTCDYCVIAGGGTCFEIALSGYDIDVNNVVKPALTTHKAALLLIRPFGNRTGNSIVDGSSDHFVVRTGGALR